MTNGGVEIPICKEGGFYLDQEELESLNLDLQLVKMIKLWSFAIQNELNWHNPNDDNLYLPDYYFDFIKKIEKDIIFELKKYDIELIKN